MGCTLYLIRHGETEHNRLGQLSGWADPPLNQVGIRQAERLALYLKGIQAHHIYHSGMIRASQTAKIINQHKHIPMSEVQTLKELHFGRFEGKTMKDLASELPEAYSRLEQDGFHFVFPEGESLVQLHQRVNRTIDNLIKAHSDETIILVSHAGTLRCILAQLIGNQMNRHWHFKIDQGSISAIEEDQGFYILTKLNQSVK